MRFEPVLLFLIRLTIESPTLSTSSKGDVADEDDGTVPPTHSTFTVQRLDAPLERIEIRLIDEKNTTTPPPSTESPVTQNPEDAIRQEVHETTPIPPPTDTPSSSSSATTSENMYRKTEYEVQATVSPTSSDDPIPIGEDASYYSTISPDRQSEMQAKAWMSVSPTMIPKFEGDIDEDDLPPPPSQETESDEKEPEEECLANQEHLSEQVVSRLKTETAHYYRLVRQRNEQQKEYCSGEMAANQDSDRYRRCSEWRAEKLVYYYKLMRKTYCQVEHWPNPSKVKKTYGEYLNLFGTFYAFQK